MSVNHTTFLVFGVRLDDHEFSDDQKDEFDPPTRKDFFDFDKIAVIVDGMNGSYQVAGYIYKQTDRNKSFDEVLTIPDLADSIAAEKAEQLQSTLGLHYIPHLEWLIVPHYY